MRSVFLSYSHMERETAEAVEQALRRLSIAAWFDKTDLYAGDMWPKALGEAIQQADALLLIWSGAASSSEFVELEWNIALALRKPVLPILSDDTVLPPALRASHGITETAPDRVAVRVEAALNALSSTPAPPPLGHKPFITQLEGLSHQDPSTVLQTVKALEQQSGWIVAGPVYQASGDIHIQDGGAKKASLSHRWKVWVWVIVGVLTAGFLLKQLVFEAKYSPSHVTQNISLSPSSTELPGEEHTGTASVSQRMSGIIVDGLDKPVIEAKVVRVGSSNSTMTDAAGRFSLAVYEAPDELVRLHVEKDGFRPLSEYFPIRQDIRVVLRRE